MQLTRFGGVPLPTIDEDLAVPYETFSNIVALPFGAYDEHGQSSVLAPYTLTRTFKIACGENTSSLNSQLDELMRVFASGRKVLEAYWRDGSKRQTYAKVINAVRPRRSDDKKYQELSVTFRIDYPYWFQTADEPHHLDHGLFLDEGWYLDGQYETITLNALSVTHSITTHGTTPLRRGYLVLRPASGASFTDLTITNLANFMVLRVTGTLAYNSTVVIDFLSRSCKLDAVNYYTAIEVPPGQMDWMLLEIGLNQIQIEAVARTGNTTIEWHWADTFL